jgi:ribosomal protein S18 acetylase RimI-like enzyme
MKIREADMNDLNVLIEFEQEIIQAEREFDNALKEGEFHYYNFQELLISPTAKVLVAEIEDEMVGSGYAVLKKADSFLKFNEYAYIGLLYVKPGHRGKGINQLILQKLKDWVAEKKVREIRLVVYDDNEKAKNAYLKAGFKAHVLEMRMEL